MSSRATSTRRSRRRHDRRGLRQGSGAGHASLRDPTFRAAAELDDLYFDHPYYVQPEGRGATKPYALLRDALAEAGKLGIDTIVLRQREHLGALEPVGEALVLTTMRFVHQIRSPKQLDLPPGTERRGR
jgi:DNA end-binding protein Ku